MIVIASALAVPVETSASSLGQDTTAICAWVRSRIAVAVAWALATAWLDQMLAKSYTYTPGWLGGSVRPAAMAGPSSHATATRAAAAS